MQLFFEYFVLKYESNKNHNIYKAMKKYIIVIILFTGLAGWQCSKQEDRANLKESLQSSAEEINMAVSKIAETRGYELISVTGDDGKSAECYNLIDTIDLDMVAGIYDYQPNAFRHHHYFFPVSFFKKTGENEHMIVNMPHRMMFRPKYFFNYCTCDTVRKNNFTIDAADYHLYFGGWNTFDYKLTAGFTYDSEKIGDCDITSIADKEEGNSYTSKFNFTEGLSITVDRVSGDTSESSFALMDEDELLLREKSIFVRSGYKITERQYILSIGKVDIKKGTGVDSVQVFLDGVLQKKAAKIVTDGEGEEKSICRKRDLEITFDDGTKTKVSTLIGPARETLKTLVSSLRDMYFARNIVDYIALSVYFNTH
jgi:hypothetical protein